MEPTELFVGYVIVSASCFTIAWMLKAISHGINKLADIITKNNKN